MGTRRKFGLDGRVWRGWRDGSGPGGGASGRGAPGAGVRGGAAAAGGSAMTEAMLRGWRAQQAARGLTERTTARRERLVRGFLECTNEFPWNWTPAHVDEWSLSLTSRRRRLARCTIPATIRWSFACSASSSSMAAMAGAVACEEAFGTHPVPICHEWKCATRRWCLRMEVRDRHRLAAAAAG